MLDRVYETNLGERIRDLISIEVNAPGYNRFHLAMRFKKAGILKFPVEMEREVEGIDV